MTERVLKFTGGPSMSLDFNMVSGDTKTLEITVRDSDGVYVDISAAQIRWQMARSVNAAAPTLTKDIGDDSSPPNIEITAAGHGTFQVHIYQDDTEDLRGNFYHEAEMTLPNGTVQTWSGKIVIAPDLIHARSGA